jgi:hypothetical protein
MIGNEGYGTNAPFQAPGNERAEVMKLSPANRMLKSMRLVRLSRRFL